MARVNKRKMNKPQQEANHYQKLQAKIKRKIVVLRNTKEKSWIWKGVIEKDESSLEEPIVLELNGKNFYFYSSAIEKRNYYTNNQWTKSYQQLSYLQQEQLLKVFGKQIDHEYWDKSTLLIMKADFLDNLTNVLYKNDNISSSEFNNLKDKFESEYENLIAEIEADVDNTLNITKFENHLITNLKNKKDQLISDQKNELINENLNNQKLIFNSKEQDQIESKIILLRNIKNHSWIWKTKNRKDDFSLEEPLVLQFGGKNFYFYLNKIEKKDYRYNNQISQLYKNLDYFQQEELLKAFDNQINNKYWDKSTVLKMKADFLFTIVDVLLDNFDEKISLSSSEFNNLKNKFESEYESFYSLINEKSTFETANQTVIAHEGTCVLNLKNKKGKLYDNLERLVKKFKQNKFDLNELIKKDFKIQELFFKYNQQDQTESKIILLKNINNHYWIWKARNVKDKFSLEEPAVLYFGKKKFYFYLKEIEEKDYLHNNSFFKINNLDYLQQEELLRVFFKQANKNEWYKSLFLKMKVDYLTSITDVLSENLDEKSNLSASEFNSLKAKFEFEYQGLIVEIQSDVNNNLDINKFEDPIIEDLINKKDNFYQKFEKLVEKFEERNIDFKEYKPIESKIILLRNIYNHSCIWKGLNKKDYSSEEEPVVLEFEGKNYYFYANGIEKKNYRYTNSFFRLYSLNYLQQEELLKKFIKQNQEKIWYKPTLLKMKVDFLDTIANILYENLYKKSNLSTSEYENFKDKFISEYQSLMVEIEEENFINNSGITAIRNLKNKKGRFYDKLEKLFEKINDKNIDFNKLTKEDIKREGLVFNLELNSVTKKGKTKIITILLKYYKNTSLIWTGISENLENSFEEPVILKFDNQDFYFYPSGIQKKNYRIVNKFSKEYEELDYLQQEQLLKAFTEQTDYKYWNISTVLRMKADFLDTMADILYQNLDLKGSLSASEFDNLKDKFLFEYESFYSLVNENQEIEFDSNNQSVVEFEDQFVKNLKYKTGIHDKFKNLIKHLKEKSWSSTTTEDLKKDLELQGLIFNLELNSNIKKSFTQKTFRKKSFRQRSIIILLKYYKNSSLVWNGTTEKDGFSKEEPAVLNFDDRNFYFYASEVWRTHYYFNSRKIRRYEKLDYSQQEKLLEIFAKQDNQEYWNKSILLKMKVVFLDTMVDILYQNLDLKSNLSASEFGNLKDKFISEYENLYSLMDQTKKDIDNNMISYYKKNLFWKSVDEDNINSFFSLNNKTTKFYQLIKTNQEINQSSLKEEVQLQDFTENELLSIENDNNNSGNVIEDLEDFDYPTLKINKLNNPELENLLNLTELIDFSRENKKKIWDLDQSELLEADIDEIEMNLKNFDSNIQNIEPTEEQKQLEIEQQKVQERQKARELESEKRRRIAVEANKRVNLLEQTKEWDQWETDCWTKEFEL